MTTVHQGGASTGTATARPAAEKKGKPAAPAAAPAPAPAPAGTVRYQTQLRESAPFDLYVGLERVGGAWNAGRTAVVWDVPDELAEALERHHFVATGRIARVD